MADNIKSDMIYTVKETPSTRDPNSGFGAWVIRYHDGTKTISVKLLIGSYYPDKETGVRRYAAKGGSKRDYETIWPHWPKVLDLFDNPPPLPGPDGLEKAPPKTDLEKPPF